MKFSISSESAQSGLSPTDDIFHDWWKVLMAEYFNVSKIDTNQNTFYGFADFFYINELFIKRSKSTPQNMKRDLRLISQLPSDIVNISLILNGGFTGESLTRKVTINEGDIIFIDKSEISSARTGYFEEVGIDIPKQAVLSNSVITKDFHLMKLSPADSFYDLMKYHILKLYNYTPENAASDSILIRSTTELIRSILTSSDNTDTSEHISTDYIWYKIYSYIDRHYKNPDLSAKSIATGVNLSRTQLYRITEPMGGINHLINKIRIKRSLYFMDKANHEKNFSLPLHEAAGYKSERTFRRAFLSSMNMTPKEAYHRLREESAEHKSLISKRTDDALVRQQYYRQWLINNLVDNTNAAVSNE